MKHGARRDLREKLYRAYIGRASEGDYDNRPLIDSILRLRREEAHLLGFESYAELSLSRKMAGTVARAERLLEELRVASYGAARRELDELRRFMKEKGADVEAEELAHWDLAYWSERLREARFDYSEEQIVHTFRCRAFSTACSPSRSVCSRYGSRPPTARCRCGIRTCGSSEFARSKERISPRSISTPIRVPSRSAVGPG